MVLEELTLHLSSKKSKAVFLTFVIAVSGIAFLGSAESFVHSKVNYHEQSYTVANGQSFNRLLGDFEISFYNKLLLKTFIKINGLNLAQAGHYNIEDLSWRTFLKSIAIGAVKIYKFEIIPGSNLYDLEALIKNSNLTHDCKNFNCLDNRYKFIEGTLKPDTYFYKHLSPVSSVLKKSQKEFFKTSNDLWGKRHPDNPLQSLSDAIILASIVEKEAGNDNEKPMIAGVFLHRLALDMKLQADPTIIYGLLPDFNGDITKANLRDKNNSYNTYQIPSLPPTPISSISQSSLEAVILGVANEYLYFVANGSGAHDFSRTYKEHLKAVKRYQLNQ